MKNYTKKLDPKDIANIEDITGGSEPAAYLKSAAVTGNKLTLKNKDDTEVEYNPSIPTKTSDLTNDSNFITPAALMPYRTATNQDAIDNALDSRIDDIEDKEAGWDAKSVVSGTASGDNWSTITIDGTVHNIPQGGGSDVQFDNQTIIEGTDGKKKTAAGGWRESASVKFSGDVESDGTSTSLTLSNTLSAAITDGEKIRVAISGPAGMLNAYYKVMESHGELSIFLDGGYDGLYLTLQDGAVGSTVTLGDLNGENIPAGTYNIGLGGGYVYHEIDGNYIPLDDDTMGLDANGKVKCLLEPGVNYGDGKGIHIDNDNNINVNFGGNLVYTDNSIKWENQKFTQIHTDVYGIEDTSVTGEIFEVGKTYRLDAYMFGDDISLIEDAKNLTINIQGVTTNVVGLSIGNIQDMPSYVINYEYEGVIRPVLVVEDCQSSIPFGDNDTSTLTLLDVDVEFISNKVINLNDSMEIDLNGKIGAKLQLPAYPSEDGNYKLHLTISSGLPTLSWVSES